VLADQRGTLVSKDGLLKAVWPDSFVEECNLTPRFSLASQTRIARAPGLTSSVTKL